VNRAGDTVANPLYSGPIAAAAGGGVTARGANIDTTSFAGPATSAQSAMASATHASFQNAINGPHGSVHVLTGGQMSSVAFAGFDPIFYLHHCNVDRLWWNWQQSHPGVAMPASEAAHELDPFNRPFSTDWQVGADVESTDDLGYRYSNWCFWIPPILVWELIPLRFDPVMIRHLRDARLVVRSDRMPAESTELRVFIDDPEADHRTAVDGNPSFVGSVAAFGMGGMQMQEAPGRARFDLELSLTDQLRRHCDEGERDEVSLKIVAVDVDGNPVDAGRLEIDVIELVLD
jgi:hypothetical protein